ncbi:hypothetical protein GI582_17010 [Sulfitobacter sp. BDSS02]|nr:hypothetical protein [Sulfitobacter sp. BDSS02]MBR9849685.1 flagellar hook assembly protein FlgD [Paracoccaceae bacterium]
MAIDPTTGATTASNSAAGNAQVKLTADYESFLKLLTAQVANQNPLEPMDSTTFVSQLAQLSQVEQSIQTNSNLEQVNAYLAAYGALSDIQLIGHEVTLASDQLTLSNGAAAFEYDLAETASTVSAAITTADGTVIRTLKNLSGTAGEVHKVEWDGMDTDGLPVQDGVYTIRMTATTAEDADVSASTYTASTVKELNFETGESVLMLDNGSVALAGSVISIR